MALFLRAIFQLFDYFLALCQFFGLFVQQLLFGLLDFLADVQELMIESVYLSQGISIHVLFET